MHRRGYGLPVVTTPTAAQIVNTVQTHIVYDSRWLVLYNTDCRKNTRVGWVNFVGFIEQLEISNISTLLFALFFQRLVSLV